MRKILVVEDDESTLNLLRTFLAAKKFGVTTATDGAEAIGLLNNNPFDLIVSDVQMYPMDGMTFLETLRQGGNETPFIIMTGHPQMDDFIQAVHKLGAFEYIQKPIDLDLLYLTIERLLKPD